MCGHSASVGRAEAAWFGVRAPAPAPRADGGAVNAFQLYSKKSALGFCCYFSRWLRPVVCFGVGSLTGNSHVSYPKRVDSGGAKSASISAPVFVFFYSSVSCTFLLDLF